MTKLQTISDDAKKWEKEFSTFWNDYNRSGDLDNTDRFILKIAVENPTAGFKRLEELTGFTKSAIHRRLNKPAMIHARMCLQGTTAEIMGRTVYDFARKLEQIVGNFEVDWLGEIKRLSEEVKDPEALKTALTMLRMNGDHAALLESGKAAVAFLSKQAELELQKRALDSGKLPTPEEAKKILEDDLA